MNNTNWEIKDECLVEKIGKITCTNEQMRNFSVGGKVTLNVNGKEITRRVYENREVGPIVRINGYEIAYMDFN